MQDNSLGFEKGKRYYFRSTADIRFQATTYVIGKAEEGWSHPDIVKIKHNDQEIIGYRKLTSTLGEKNSIEVVLGRIGKLIDISMAETLCVFSNVTYDSMIAIISVSVAETAHEKFISFREMRDELFYDLKNGAITLTPWLKRWMKIRERKKLLPADRWEVDVACEQDYFDCVQFALEVSRLYANKHKLKLVDFDVEYVKMLLFDILIGQADRSPSNYGLLIDEQLNVGRLAPLFDNSTLTKPYIPDGYMSFNQVLLDREMMAKTVCSLFRESATDFVNKIIDKKSNIMSIINDGTFYTCDETRSFLDSVFKEGFLLLEQVV